MSKAKIIVHCLVKNEENFIWYALNSVLPYVDKIMVWDTGSKDRTIDIIKLIKSPKIDFQEVHSISAREHPRMRNKMLEATDKTKYRWLMILDGDEIWPSKNLEKVIYHLETHPETQAVYMRTFNTIGDIFHKRVDSAGHYHIKDMTGCLNLRFLNLKNIPGLHAKHPHGQEGYYSGDNILVQDLPKVDFVETFYLHTTRLRRSPLDDVTLKRKGKRKLELGDRISQKMLPEILFVERPSIVPDVTKPMSYWTFLLCALFTIPRRLRRKLVKLPEGY
jgi:hypothetical protein